MELTAGCVWSSSKKTGDGWKSGMPEAKVLASEREGDPPSQSHVDRYAIHALEGDHKSARSGRLRRGTRNVVGRRKRDSGDRRTINDWARRDRAANYSPGKMMCVAQDSLQDPISTVMIVFQPRSFPSTNERMAVSKKFHISQ